jgi:hypothetical protein
VSLKSRLLKLENIPKAIGIVVVIVADGSTNEKAYQRLFPNGEVNPKRVVYLTPLDVLL